TTILVVIFYVVDKGNKEVDTLDGSPATYSNKVRILGSKNFLWLAIIIGAVFIDPNVFPDIVPGIMYDGQNFSFIREIIMLTVAYLSYRFANKKALAGNDFNFEPIKEVAFSLIGIFGTMMPALELVGHFAQAEPGAGFINHATLFWGTGLLSGVLDSAATYLNCLAAAMASQGASLDAMGDVQAFAAGGT